MEPKKERERRLGRRLVRSFVSADSYGLVLLLIVITYALSVSLTARWAVSLVLAVQIATVWLALRTSQARRVTRVSANVLLVVAAAVAVANLVVSDGASGFPLVFLASSFLYLIAPFSIVRHLGFRGEVDQETVFGAIAAYLLIGMFFAFAYRSLGGLQAGSFFGADGDGTMSQTLFFSFITLTTTGYGNLVPAANPGQSLAVAEALIGQLFLVSAVAKVVNAWTPKRLAPGEPKDPPAEG